MITNLKPDYLISLLLGALGAALILVLTSFSSIHQKKIVTIDLTKIVNDYIKAEAEQNKSAEATQRDVKAYAGNLEAKLQLYAEHNNLIVLPKEAVLTGATDNTNAFLATIQ